MMTILLLYIGLLIFYRLYVRFTTYYVYYNNYGVNVPGLLIRHPLHPPTFVPFDRECGIGILKIDKSDFHLITPMEGKSNV